VSGDSSPTDPTTTPAREALTLSRAEHSISRRDIHPDALRVLHRLSAFGFRAYLVGGSVRDLMLRKQPKDFDVGTDARPSRLKRIFRNCRIIGRRFRIAHVFFPDGKIIEVSTFRKTSTQTVRTENGMILVDNQYGTPQEDALRRDITINGLFYDIDSFSVIDYVGGVRDLRDGIIRTIADPQVSFREDPVRMIRVQRHAARTGFQIEPNTLSAIYQERHEIKNSNTARLLEETLRDLRGGAAAPFYQLLMETHLFDCLLPSLSEQLRTHGPDHPFWRRMRALDQATKGGASFTSPVLLGLLFHTVLFADPGLWLGLRGNPPDVWRYISSNWKEISKTVRISRRDMERMAQILISFRKLMQSLERRRLLPALQRKPYLSEALDFFQIDLESTGRATEILKEWRKFAPPPQQPEPRYGFFFADEGDATGPEEPPTPEAGAEPWPFEAGPGPERRSRSERHGNRRRSRRGRRGRRGHPPRAPGRGPGPGPGPA